MVFMSKKKKKFNADDVDDDETDIEGRQTFS